MAKQITIDLATLKQIVEVLEVAFQADGDTFGMMHNDAVDALTAAHAAIAGAERVESTGWQPIETAPRDGRSFDVWVKSTKNPDYNTRMTGVYYSQGVLCGARFPDISFGEYATHWMPLPTPPKESKA